MASLVAMVLGGRPGVAQGLPVTPSDEASCRVLLDVRNVTITAAEIRRTAADATPYCYARGTISPAIRYHVQLPLQTDWNGPARAAR